MNKKLLFLGLLISGMNGWGASKATLSVPKAVRQAIAQVEIEQNETNIIKIITGYSAKVSDFNLNNYASNKNKIDKAKGKISRPLERTGNDFFIPIIQSVQVILEAGHHITCGTKKIELPANQRTFMSLIETEKQRIKTIISKLKSQSTKEEFLYAYISRLDEIINNLRVNPTWSTCLTRIPDQDDQLSPSSINRTVYSSSHASSEPVPLTCTTADQQSLTKAQKNHRYQTKRT